MQVRAALPTDLRAAQAVVAAAYAAYRSSGLDLPDVTAGLDEDIAAGRVWVADSDGPVLGVLVVTLSDTHGHLQNVAVDPSHHGRGVGTALIAKAVDLVRAAGLPQLRLTTHRMMPGNLALYGRLGWVETGRDGDKVFMVRDIAETGDDRT